MRIFRVRVPAGETVLTVDVYADRFELTEYGHTVFWMGREQVGAVTAAGIVVDLINDVESVPDPEMSGL